MDFLADIVTSPKKIVAFVLFLVGVSLLGTALGNAQNPNYPHWKLGAELAGGFLIGSVGAISLYWLRSSEKRVKDIDQIAVETLANHAAFDHQAKLEAPQPNTSPQPPQATQSAQQVDTQQK